MPVATGWTGLSQEIANDWQVIDNLENITYSPKNNDPTFVIPNANRSMLTKDWAGTSRGGPQRSIGVGSLLHQEFIIFNVWVNQYNGLNPPVLGDSFVDSEGYTWVVDKVDVATLRTRYRLTCQQKK